MSTFLSNAWHYIVALAVIGALAGLAAVGVVSGTAAVDSIVAIGSAMGVGGLVAKAASSTPPPATPTAPVTAVAVQPRPVAAPPQAPTGS